MDPCPPGMPRVHKASLFLYSCYLYRTSGHFQVDTSKRDRPIYMYVVRVHNSCYQTHKSGTIHNTFTVSFHYFVAKLLTNPLGEIGVSMHASWQARIAAPSEDGQNSLLYYSSEGFFRNVYVYHLYHHSICMLKTMRNDTPTPTPPPYWYAGNGPVCVLQTL